MKNKFVSIFETWVFCFIMLWIGYRAEELGFSYSVASVPSWGSPFPDPGTPEGACAFLGIFAVYLLFRRPLIHSDPRAQTIVLLPRVQLCLYHLRDTVTLSRILPLFPYRQSGQDSPRRRGG